MKTRIVAVLLMVTGVAMMTARNKQPSESPTEGVITMHFLGEEEMKHRCMAMLCRFMEYGQGIYIDTDDNRRGEKCGFFKARHAGMSDEDGVRTNADMAMVTAFVWHHAQSLGMTLPEGIGYDDLQRTAKRALSYALSTHRSNALAKCKDGKYWGSDAHHHQWESSLWVLSVVLSAHFLGTDETTRALLENMVAAEADYELTREVPTGFKGDTKAEENGWEANVLACACALMPDHEHATLWHEAMLRYAFNCYTVAADATETTMVGGRRACDWYAGANLYDDYTLQNHNYFHTSYQNVVMQELAESMIALRLLNADMSDHEDVMTWHWQEVWDEVLAPLALCDGELAMPNGNDWSMFLYDQLPAYAAMATIKGNDDALMLENMALKMTEARQRTTTDGAWMLNSDIGPRRMGVTAHRVMMTWLMHHLYPTGQRKPTKWEKFRRRQAAPRVWESQQMVRSMSKQRFVCFSWSEGLKNANCLMVPNLPDRNKIVVPYKKGVGGNLTGHPQGYVLDGQPTFHLDKHTWQASAQLRKGDQLMTFTISDCGKNKVRMDYEGGDSTVGLLAISTDPLTRTKRTLFYEGGQTTTDGTEPLEMSSQWVNIDNEIGVISLTEDNLMWFGGRKVVNSIYTSLLYPCHKNTDKSRGTLLYFVNQKAEDTRRMWKQVTSDK